MHNSMTMLNMADPANVVLMMDKTALRVLDKMDQYESIEICYEDAHLGSINLNEQTLLTEEYHLEELENQALFESVCRWEQVASGVIDMVEEEVDDFYDSDDPSYMDYGDFIDYLMDKEYEEN